MPDIKRQARVVCIMRHQPAGTEELACMDWDDQTTVALALVSTVLRGRSVYA
jgi:hypothetical protein